MNRAHLGELIKAVEAGTFDATNERPARFNAFMDLAEHVFPQDVRALNANGWNAYRGDLNAAMALHKALLPGFFVTLTRLCKEWDGDTITLEPDDWRAEVYDGTRNETGIYETADSADPARAWLLAILRALEAAEAGG
jgi:hypothetical protein